MINFADIRVGIDPFSQFQEIQAQFLDQFLTGLVQLGTGFAAMGQVNVVFTNRDDRVERRRQGQGRG